MDPLQQIIQSLSPTEKRYCSMFATAFKGDSELLKLFKVLSEEGKYDEKKIGQKTGIKNLTKAKSNLRKLVLKAMRNYHEEDNVAQQLRDALSDIEFLITKGFYEEARKEIHKAWKIAEKNEAHGHITQLLYLLSAVNYMTLTPDKRAKNFDTIWKEMNEAHEKQLCIDRAHLRNHHIGYLVRLGYSGDSYEAEFDEQVEWSNTQLQLSKSKYADTIILNSLAVCYQVSDRPEKAIDTYERIRTIFKQNPPLIHVNPKAYIVFLINYGVITTYDPLLKSKAWQIVQETEQAFILLKDFFTATPDKLFQYRERFINNKLAYAKANKIWNMLPQLEAEVKRHLLGNQEKVVAALQASSVSSCFYEMGNYKKMLEWVNIYYTLDDAKILKPLMICVRVLEVLAFNGLKQFDISDTKAINLYKTFVEQKFTDDFHKNLGGLLRKINHWGANDKNSFKEIEKLKSAFLKLKESNDGNYILYNEYFDPIEILEHLTGKAVAA